MEFVARVQRGERVTELCREYGISRKTAYKFIGRFERLGPIGLYDEAKVPARTPHRISEAVETLIVEVRKEHPTWGPRKLKAWLTQHHPGLRVPATSTLGRVLLRRDLIHEGRRRTRRPVPAPSSAMTMAHEPNAVWCCDFKGQFRLGNARYCYPLTVTDLYSRYLIGCEAMDRIRTETVQAAFTALFREHGMPHAILSDNGAPFASNGILGLSRLSAWWLRLGIEHKRITPGHPEENGAHERMHLTLKKETTRPAAANALQQQERFDRFREIFNTDRPHEALGQKPPATVYEPSPRAFPNELPEPRYPLHDLVLRVNDGRIYFNGKAGAVGRALDGQLVGLREVEENRFVVNFMHLELGIFDLRTERFERAA
jgi:transposase InsO family protein